MFTTRTLLTTFAVTTFCSALAVAQPLPYSVSFQEGVRQPRMSASAVAASALALQQDSIDAQSPGASSPARSAEPALRPDAPAITSIECIRGTEFRSAMTGATGADADDPLWIVRMTGRFINYRTPAGVPTQARRTGFYVIDDTSGDVVAYGSGGDGLSAK